jgi:hypothetical protein
MKSRLCLASIASFASWMLTWLALPAWAGIGPAGSEFQVNHSTEARQYTPVAAYAPSGRALVVWENPRRGIRGVFYDADGNLASREMTLVANQLLPSPPAEGNVAERKQPAVAFLPNGDFLLAWTEERSYLRTDIFFEQRFFEDRDVFVQRFSAAGVPMGPSVRVSDASGLQSQPRLVARRSGDFVVVWEWTDGYVPGIFGRLVSASGRLVGTEFRVSAEGVPAIRPAVAAGNAGRFVVTWQAPDGDDAGIFARLYDNAAAPLGAEFRVNADVAGRQQRPTVAAHPSGDFLVLWQGQHLHIDRSLIFGQLLGAGGALLGPQLAITREDDPVHFVPAVAPAPGGTFLATWMNWAKEGGIWIDAVQLDKDGSPAGAPFRVTERRVLRSAHNTIAAKGTGTFLVPFERVLTKRRSEVSARLLVER